MLVIGITGGTGCGKTTALNALQDFGGAIVDCDALYHSLLETNQQMLGEIYARFPAAFPGGKFDRKALGGIVFSDPQALAALNAITGRYVVRAVGQWLERARAAGAPVAAIDAIGLLESRLAGFCDKTVAILAPTAVRVSRLMAREGISEEYAKLRIAAQKSNEYFQSHCDMILMNDCDSAAAFAARSHEAFQTLIKEYENGTR